MKKRNSKNKFKIKHNQDILDASDRKIDEIKTAADW
jgi:hypothetical protein